MTNEQFESLKKPFKPNEVQWRVSVTTKTTPMKGLAVPYLDSRAIQNRLDSVIGRENWQNEFTTCAMGKDNAFISTISIFCSKRNEWISKSNGAGSTNIEPVKGGLSDAFKRAASMWDIGRYLYEFNGVWVELDERKNIAQKELPKLEKSYTDTVKRLFPIPSATAKPPSEHAPQQSNLVTQQSQPPQATAIKVVPRLAAAPLYTVVSARLNQDHTVLALRNAAGQVFTAYFNGEAKVAQNQQITDAVITEKTSTSGKYYVLETYRIADSSDYPQMAA